MTDKKDCNAKHWHNKNVIIVRYKWKKSFQVDNPLFYLKPFNPLWWVKWIYNIFIQKGVLQQKPKAKGFLKCKSIKYKGIFETYSKGEKRTHSTPIITD